MSRSRLGLGHEGLVSIPATAATCPVELAHPPSKRIKLFYFMAAQTRTTTVATPHAPLTAADVDKQYALFTSDSDITRGLNIFNDKRFRALRPLARKLFTVPASSAAIVNAYLAELAL